MSTDSSNAVDGLPDDAAVESRARDIFDTACEEVDALHAVRLRLARHRAIDASARRWPPRTWAPLVGAAACCALAIGIAWTYPGLHSTSTTDAAASAPSPSSPVVDDDAAPDLGSSQMEMVQNLDFYRWLASQPTLAGAPAGGGP